MTLAIKPWKYSGLLALAMAFLALFGYFIVTFGAQSLVPYAYGLVGWVCMLFAFVYLPEKKIIRGSEEKTNTVQRLPTGQAAFLAAFVVAVVYVWTAHFVLVAILLPMMLGAMAVILLFATFLLFIDQDSHPHPWR